MDSFLNLCEFWEKLNKNGNIYSFYNEFYARFLKNARSENE